MLSPSLQTRLEQLSFYSRRRILGSRQGGHRSLKLGFGSEFSDYRQYTPGDNPRHIDWGVYARSDRLYVKQFHEEQELSVLIILDASGSMTLEQTPSKWEFAKALALALVFIALKNQDKVRIHVLGGATSPLLFGANAVNHANRFISQINLEQTKISSAASQDQSLIVASQYVKVPGIALLVSDFLFKLESIDRGLQSLLSKSVLLHLLRVLSPEDINPFPLNDSPRVRDRETGEEFDITLGPEERDRYRSLTLAHEQSIRDYARAVRAEFVQVHLESPFDKKILDLLSKSSFIQ